MIEDANKAYEAENFEEALSIYEKMREEQPDNLDVLEGLARSCYRLKRFEQALKYCSEALRKDISVTWPHLVQSYIYFLQKRMDTCKDEARIAIEDAPSDWETNFWWGTLLVVENNIDAGLVFLEKAVSTERNNWYLYNNLSIAYSKSKQNKKYHDALENMYRLKPNLRLALLIHIEEVARYFWYLILLILYLFTLLSIFFRTPMLLIIPAIMDALWIILGIANFLDSKRIERRGILFIFLGIIHGFAIFGVYSVLR